ncbi:MAG: cytochrome P460 family protein, partial [Gammaproteobacteria bacterium]|nr:cytochrome P460 family protein [Gammaproteobacteria bacterium]
MKRSFALVIMLGASPAFAADVTAGMEKAATCAACHGINGISVSGDIPNLAGQKAEYLVTQLKAFKDGSRKNPLMNAIAPQLEEADMQNLAAYFSGLSGADGTAASDLPPDINKTRVTFPGDYQTNFVRYTTINFPDRNQVRHYYANNAALEAARAGQPLPNGSFLLVEVFKAKLGADSMPVEGSDGFFESDKLAAYTAMEMQAGW